MSQERLGNIGYAGFSPEVTKGTPVTPTIFVPLYEESLKTNPNFQPLQPIYGHKHATYSTLKGQRSHMGDMTIMAEPNTTGYVMDMLYTKTASAAGTHSFELDDDTNPHSYTVDISTGNVVKRFFGVEASKYSPNWNDNELQHKLTVSALGSFQSAIVSSVTGSGPYTVNLDTSYDETPTKGLVVGDLIRFYDVSAGTYINATIASVSTSSFTTSTNPSGIVANDMVYLRPATPAFSLLQPFTWAKTQFRMGDDATAALAAAQVRVEQGSTFELTHNFKEEGGEMRSGGHDPAALLRTTGEETLSIKRFFDTPDEAIPFFKMSKKSIVIRHFAGSTNQYEFRVTFNNVTTDTPFPNIKAGEINYSEITYHPNYDETDSQAVQVDVINGITSF